MKLISVLAAVVCVGLPLCFAAAILPTCQDQDLTITVDNELVLYIDGVEITDLPNANNWELADTVFLSASVRLIAVRGKDVGVVAGILASAASFVTDNSWRCSNDETIESSEDWYKPEYDDSNWSAAYVIGNNGMSPWGQIKEISVDAKWIWTSNWEYPQTDNHVTYCRKIIQCSAPPTPAPCSGTGSACITSCDGRKDGDYQSCRGCSVYASCSNNILIDGRSCAPNPGGSPLVWDDIKKRCDYTSNTCKNCAAAAAVAPPLPCSGTGSACITSCDGRKDGDYQSCHGCSVYASCSNNILTDDRPCLLNSGDRLSTLL